MSVATSGGYDQDAGHLSYGQLSFLTLQAVFQTVIICLIGYVAARKQWLCKDVQKHVSNLNVMVFTPCLIFSKLARSLSLSALIDIAVIPVFFVLMTAISLGCARSVSRLLRLTAPETNFVTAMAVFGNSNSLPVSLTVSLAYTLPMLRWPDIPEDNPDDVASRGILYLLIFQQLGQIIRWSWGYNSLLAKQEPKEEPESLIDDEEYRWPESPRLGRTNTAAGIDTSCDNVRGGPRSISPDSQDSRCGSDVTITEIPQEYDTRATSIAADDEMVGRKSPALRYWRKFLDWMNPPLWSMVFAIIVASIPAAKYELYEKNGFVANTVGSAITQVGKLAIPLILIVLGSNLAPDTSLGTTSPHHNKIVFASLLCRMVLPSLLLLPVIACSVKYLSVSILDDPIFLLVAFILTVSPPAIQLSQICQLNGVFEKEMASVLFWGYVVLTLPSTIIIVVSSLEVLNWAGVTSS